MTSMKITFLGTGTSHGVPSIDCMLNDYSDCRKGVCKASLNDPLHQRTRSSILIETNGKHLLVDVSSDFRVQALREKIPKLDAVLITHCHSDHISGIPDIRSYTKSPFGPLPFYGSSESMNYIRAVYPYIFNPNAFLGGGIPNIVLNPVSGLFNVVNLQIECLPVEHGGLKGALGYKIGNVAYISDVKEISCSIIDLIKHVDVLILNCLRENKVHSSHLTLEQSVDIARTVKPKKCFFTHMSHDIDYRVDIVKLDPWMFFANDGLKIEL